MLGIFAVGRESPSGWVVQCWQRYRVDDTVGAPAAGQVTEASNRFIWEEDGRTAARVLSQQEVEGVATRQVSFFLQSGRLPIWYRLWIGDDNLVRRAEMRTQSHFMDHRYYDFDADIDIQPPT